MATPSTGTGLKSVVKHWDPYTGELDPDEGNEVNYILEDVEMGALINFNWELINFNGERACDPRSYLA